MALGVGGGRGVGGDQDGGLSAGRGDAQGGGRWLCWGRVGRRLYRGWCGGGLELIGAQVVIQPRPCCEGVGDVRIAHPGVAQDVGRLFAGKARVSAVDRRRPFGQLEVSARRAHEPRIGLDTGLLLTRGGLHRRERCVRRLEDVHRPWLGQPHQVVVDDGRWRGRVPDADVAVAPCAGDAVVCRVDSVVHGDVVGNQVVAGCALDVDTGGAVAEDRVPDQPASRDVEIVDAVVAVVVQDVERCEVVVAAREELQARVLVVVRDVADDRVAGADDVDSVGVALPSVGVPAGLVVAHRRGGGPARDEDPVVAVAVADVSGDQRGRARAQADAGSGQALGGLPRGRDRVAGDGDVVAVRDVDPVLGGAGERQVRDGDVTATGHICAVGQACADDGRPSGPGGDQDNGGRGPGDCGLDGLGIGAVPDVELQPGGQLRDAFGDAAERGGRRARTVVRARRHSAVDVERGDRFGVARRGAGDQRHRGAGRGGDGSSQRDSCS